MVYLCPRSGAEKLGAYECSSQEGEEPKSKEVVHFLQSSYDKARLQMEVHPCLF